MSCSSHNYVVQINKDASIELLNRIDFLEKQLKRKKAKFYLVEDIVNLSGITTESWDGSWIGVQYFPSENEILKWKKWIEDNKEKLYYEPYKSYEEGKFYYEIYVKDTIVGLPLGRPIISYKALSGEIISSFSPRPYFFVRE